MLSRVWGWLSRIVGRLGGSRSDDEAPRSDVATARARFWAELREGQREADARMPTRRS
jgi:hypothetical protein